MVGVMELKGLLSSVRANAGPLFTGTGLLVSDEPGRLPLYPLRDPVVLPLADNITECLARVSVPASALHDGFHVISTSGQLLLVAQYFSPPIVHGAHVDYRRPFGGRYLAALFGSTLPSVVMAGIASASLGVAVFRNGREEYAEDLA